MTDVDIDIAVNKFTAFAGCLWLMQEELDPGIFCRCRLEPENPSCWRKRRIRGRTLRRQTRPCGRPPALHRSRSRRVHAASVRGDSGSADDGGDGGGADHRCSVCGFFNCATPFFCSLCRQSDALRNAKCWGRA